ncbi:MAG TPA: hypothetical protein VHN77_07015 [Phycisphaerales bacterium]|nr:hypothetical protein [Phycisphaerales bacterium]
MSRSLGRLWAGVAACVCAALSLHARGQCGDWEAVGTPPRVNSTARMIELDIDGDGPQPSKLVVAGNGPIGGVQGALVMWDGDQWSRLAAPGSADALCVHDGRLVVVNWQGRCIQRREWTGAWTTLAAVTTWGSFQLASDGTSLYFSGGRLEAGGQTLTSGIKKFDGSSWSEIPGDLTNFGSAAVPAQIVAFGGRVAVSGQFSHIDGVPFQRFALWNGAAWETPGWNDYHTPRIGLFQNQLYAIGRDILKLVDGAWQVVPRWTIPGYGHATDVGVSGSLIDASGIYLFGNYFPTPLRFDGQAWTPHSFWPGWVMTSGGVWRGQLVGTMDINFGWNPGSATIAVDEHGSWRPLGDGLTNAPSAMLAWNGCLYIGGIGGAGGLTTGGIASFDGHAWDTLAGGVPRISYWGDFNAMVAANGALVVAAGGYVQESPTQFRRVGLWSWDGMAWTEFPGGWRSVRLLEVHQESLIACGTRTGVSGDRVARWNGASWTDIATECDLLGRLWSDGQRLWSTGTLTPVGGSALSGLAAWDGAQWSAAMDGLPWAGPMAVLQGSVHLSDGCGRVYRWNGTRWDRVAGTDGACHGSRSMTEYHGDLMIDGFPSERWSPDQGLRPFGTDAQTLNGSPGPRPVAVFHDSVYYGGELSVYAPGFTRNYLVRWTDRPLCDCDGIDFNRDGLSPDITDVTDFFEVFQGGECVNGLCDIDFNNDGLFPDTLDIQAFLSVFSGGECGQ